MENSTIKALLTGVNVLIFVFALTVAITLMTGIINLSNNATDIIKVTNTNALKEISDESELKRIINGNEVLKYNTKKQENINDLQKYNIHVKVLGTNYTLKDFCYDNQVKDILSMEFTLTVVNDIDIYLTQEI